MAIVVTDEMRRAVCEESGHEVTFGGLFTGGGSAVKVENFEGKIPHIRCNRCRLTWLVIEIPGEDYPDAVNKLKGRLRDGDPLKDRLAAKPADPPPAPTEPRSKP